MRALGSALRDCKRRRILARRTSVALLFHIVASDHGVTSLLVNSSPVFVLSSPLTTVVINGAYESVFYAKATDIKGVDQYHSGSKASRTLSLICVTP